MKQSVLATGINGLVGSHLAQHFAQKYSFEKLDISDQQNPVDITNETQVMEFISNSDANYLVHFAAYTNVTGAWEQRGDKSGLAYQVNVIGTQNILKACKEFNKHLIHISTAYVFDGEKKGLYTEEDKLNPIEWYGQTKAEAEILVTNSEIDWTILRIDQPFRSDAFPRADIAKRIITGLKEGNLYPQFHNHYFGPTFIDDFSKIIDWVIRTASTGLYHASSGEQWTDFKFAKLINETLGLKKAIKSGDLTQYLQTLERPYQKNTAMDSNKIEQSLDFSLTTIEEAVRKIKI